MSQDMRKPLSDSRQLGLLSAFRDACSAVGCEVAPAWVLEPGGTLECDVHADYHRSVPAWIAAFEAGTARLRPLRGRTVPDA